MVKQVSLAALTLTVLLLAAQTAHADDRTSALIRHFDRFCLQKPPNFDRLDEAAVKSAWHVHSDRMPELPEGQKLHAKSWVLEDETGPYEFGISTHDEGSKHSESCGIGVPDVNGAALREDLVKTLKLGAPEKETDSADGTRSLTFWKTTAAGAPVTVMLTHDKAADAKGLYLNAYVQTGGEN